MVKRVKFENYIPRDNSPESRVENRTEQKNQNRKLLTDIPHNIPDLLFVTFCEPLHPRKHQIVQHNKPFTHTQRRPQLIPTRRIIFR